MWANRSDIAHQKWANERIARFFEQIAHSLIFFAKKSDSLWKAPKTDEQIPSPAIIPFNSREIKFALQTLEPDGLVII